MRDGAKQKYCMKGLHKLEGDNLIISSDGKRRTCRRCTYDRHNEYRRRKRQ